jgi:hypothetical protein
MHEQLDSCTGSESRPQGVGKREAVYEIPGARPTITRNGDDDLGRIPRERREAQSIRNGVERSTANRGDDRRKIQPQGGEE